MMLATSYNAMKLPRRGGGSMRVDGVAGNGPGRYCSPRHLMLCNSRDEGSKCVSKT
jgi:hypothetical protein